MRAVGLSDLDVATRVLMTLPASDRSAQAMRMIEAAHAADLWRKRYGVAHPAGGTGSLCAQAALYPRVASSRCSPEYCAALADLLAALADWRLRLDPKTNQ